MADILEKAKEEQAKKLLASGRSPAAAAVEGGSSSGQSNSAVQGALLQSATNSAMSSAQQGDLGGTAGGALMTAGVASANPYLMAGGLGLTVLSAGEANKRKEKEAQRQAYNERIKARQQALNNIANIRLE